MNGEDFDVSFENDEYMDKIFQGMDQGFNAVQDSVKSDLSASSSTNHPVSSDVPAGTRVAFRYSLESMLSYKTVPPKGQCGTVVTVRTAGVTSTTVADGRLFVKWDNGTFSATYPEHLRHTKTRTASTVTKKFAHMSDLLASFLPSSNGGDTLVHKATRDLWSLSEKDGQFVIERLFDDTGGPLKGI